jgi:hypothetical protein
MEQDNTGPVSRPSRSSRAASALLRLVGTVVGLAVAGYGAAALIQYANTCPGGKDCANANPVVGIIIILFGFSIIGAAYKKAKADRSEQ